MMLTHLVPMFPSCSWSRD